VNKTATSAAQLAKRILLHALARTTVDYLSPLSFFVFISRVNWLPFLSFVHCPLLLKKIVAYRFIFDFLDNPADEFWH